MCKVGPEFADVRLVWPVAGLFGDCCGFWQLSQSFLSGVPQAIAAILWAMIVVMFASYDL